jgi:hypothetical protein
MSLQKAISSASSEGEANEVEGMSIVVTRTSSSNPVSALVRAWSRKDLAIK